MAIVQLQSSNPALSFILKKNPNSGMLIRTIRKGNAHGWYSGNDQFNVYFKDADNEISYKRDEREEFEYLNLSRYNTPLFPLNVISEFFSSTTKEQHPQDTEGFAHHFFVNMIHIERSNYIEFFQKHLLNCQFEVTNLAHKSYSLKISTNQSIYYLLHVSNVVCVFFSMFGKEYLDLSDKSFEKYINSINIIDAPFYIRNLFTRNFLTSSAKFRKYKPEIEKTSRYQINFAFGGTGMQRRDFIRNLLPFDKAILDVGCGEGFYAFSYAAKIEDNYYAVDIDQELLEAVARKAVTKEVDNISTYSSVDQFLENYNEGTVDIILTEVIEHMSLEDATVLIKQLLKRVEFDHFIITTPNRDFNQFYEIDRLRHDDHQWELGQRDFQTWITQVLEKEPLHFEFLAIGDRVNQISTTQGVHIRKDGQLHGAAN